MLNVAGSDLFRLENAQATPFDHGWPAHADVAVAGGNDDVGTAQQRCIAGKTAPGHDAHHRHGTIEPGKTGKGGDVQPGDFGRVHIARPATATFGKQDDRQLLLQRNAQQPVRLLVIAHALGARQHREVVSHYYAARLLGAEQLRVDTANAGDHAVGRGVGDQVVQRTAPGLRRNRQRAVLDETGVA